AFYDRFWGFTFLQGTGETIGVVPVGRFFSTDAAFTGGEVEIGVPVFEEGEHRLHVVGRADYVWAQNLDADQPLPRIPPLRFGGSLIYGYDAFQAQLDAVQAQAQNRVPAGEFTTDGYTMLDLSFSYDFGLDTFVRPLLFFRISNLLNEEARASESFLKDRAPLPGRNFTGGVEVRF
ncbi:MAG: TonB-dependent receptor, partial [Deltaproteobacteria bacterium]|nr:TonB-dependent receptor [Deltaproteobacteria bacterium]